MKRIKRISAGFLAGTLAIALCANPVSAKSDDTKNRSSKQLLQRVNVSKNDAHAYYELQDSNGTAVSIEPSTTSSKKRGALPTSYNCSKLNIVTPIKDQGETGSCWAFGAIKSLESNCIRQNISSLENTDFSENHLAWYSYHGEENPSSPLYGETYLYSSNPYDAGGDAIMAAATLANHWGAANEEDAPFLASDKEQVDSMIATMEQAVPSLRYKSEVQLNSAICYDYANRTVVKQAIMEHGAVDTALYSDVEHYYHEGNSFYQDRFNASFSNHCVTIVGWDDNFDDFDPKNSPSSPGAWLIANSYGTDVFDKGYTWVSYEDTSLCDMYSFIAEKNTYDTNFQYDAVGYFASVTGSSNQKTSNVFTNTTDTPQQIEAAGFYSVVPNQKYKVEVYRKLTGSTPDTGMLVADCTVSGRLANPGYYNIQLNQPVAVDKNEVFAIVVTYYKINDTSYVPVEGTGSWGEGYCTLSSKTGQSYIYSDTNKCWEDTTNYDIPVNRFQTKKQNLNNLCIKALATNLTEEEYRQIQQEVINKTTVHTITASASKYSIGKNETIDLNIATTPYVPMDYLTFDVSDSTVATVSPDGIITGISEGTATVTVTAASGIACTAKITVKKEPTSVKAVLTKKKIKIGKTTRVKAKLSSDSASYKITYQSMNKKIATVNTSGKITAKKKGTVKIKVTTYNGKTSTVKLKVTK